MSGLGDAKTVDERDVAGRVAEDAQAMSELRGKLDKLIGNEDARPLTRPNAIRLLALLSECLGPALDETICVLEEGERVFKDHPSIELLNELSDALADLDNGKTHGALKRDSHGANRKLETWQSRRDKVWLDTVIILQRMEQEKRPDGQIVPRKSAEVRLARALRAARKTRQGRAVTQKLLKSLRDRS